MEQRTDSQAIGIFDSGLGGLTVARAVRRAFPREPTLIVPREGVQMGQLA